MWRHKAFSSGVLSVALLVGLGQASAAESRERSMRVAGLASEPAPAMKHVSGEITWVDVNLGKLQLREEGVYRINRHATNVTDPSDQRFLTLEDLRSGQFVAIEFGPANIYGERMARKITVESARESLSQEAVGMLEAVDTQAGTLVLKDRGELAYFVFEPREIIVMKDPSRQPVRLELKPGDPVKVEYVVRDGKRQVHALTLYSEFPRLTQ